MYTNDLLNEKYKAQKKFAAKAKYNIKKYLTDTEKEINEIEKKYKISFFYSKNNEVPKC